MLSSLVSLPNYMNLLQDFGLMVFGLRQLHVSFCFHLLQKLNDLLSGKFYSSCIRLSLHIGIVQDLGKVSCSLLQHKDVSLDASFYPLLPIWCAIRSQLPACQLLWLISPVLRSDIPRDDMYSDQRREEHCRRYPQL